MGSPRRFELGADLVVDHGFDDRLLAGDRGAWTAPPCPS